MCSSLASVRKKMSWRLRSKFNYICIGPMWLKMCEEEGHELENGKNQH